MLLHWKYNSTARFPWQCIIKSLIHINGPFVLNDDIRFATIQRSSEPSMQSFLSMTQGEMDADACSENLIRHAVPPQLCSSLSFSLALIRPLNWIPVRFYHFYVVLCLCTLPRPSHSRSTSHSICLHFSAFSIHANSAFVTPKGWHFSRLCYCKAVPRSSDDVTTEQIFSHCVG